MFIKPHKFLIEKGTKKGELLLSMKNQNRATRRAIYKLKLSFIPMQNSKLLGYSIGYTSTKPTPMNFLKNPYPTMIPSKNL